MRHVAPHRWADALAGKLSPREAAAIASHAETCAKCDKAREQITAAANAFVELRDEPAPELRWDRIRAQVYWETSTVLRKKKRRVEPLGTETQRALRASRRSSMAVPVAALAAAAAVVIAVASGPVPRRPAPFNGVPMTFVGTPQSTDVVGVLTLVRGDATVDGQAAVDAFARPLGAGSEIRTGSGDVSVQFGDGSAFSVGPRSVLRLRQFDRYVIALEIDGRIDVEVAPRAPGQRFAVIAGERTVEVRGTGFRVERIKDAVAVRCRHGKIAVSDNASEVEVMAGQGFDVPSGAAVSDAAVRGLGAEELAELAAAAPHQLSVWAPVDALTSMTAPLTVVAAPERAVRVDGDEVGRGSVTVRVVSGRHLVEAEAADKSGSGATAWLSSGWVDVRGGVRKIEIASAPPPDIQPPTQIAPPPLKPPTGHGGRALRHREFERQIDDVRPCLRAAAKQGLTDVFARVKISVDANGAIRYANIVDTDLPAKTTACVRDAVAAMQFEPGPAVTWQEDVRP
jgi:ferric-dicitrate binding protein FerR (iron transport regulator)